jgi:hypothetical protein
LTGASMITLLPAPYADWRSARGPNAHAEQPAEVMAAVRDFIAA